MRYDVVVPTIGRASLGVLLRSLAATTGPRPERLVVVDDRRTGDAASLESQIPATLRGIASVVRTGGGGPARARNAGARAGAAPFVAFLDDDVVLAADWAERLVADLAVLEAGPEPARVAGSYARIVVPPPIGRAPTDWERNVAHLERAAFITADAVFRRAALASVGGFDERFPRAFREDADLALRLAAAGYALVRGDRTTTHPVRPASRWVSVTLQRGNADDALMRALHGDLWSEAPHERDAYAEHERIVAETLEAARALVRGDGRAARSRVARALRRTLLFAARRIAAGPLRADEIATMLATSAVIPFAAVGHRLRGERRARALLTRAKAVLFDRDGTLVVDTPIRGDASLVDPVPEAAAALERLRAVDVAIGVVTNQPGLARGAFTERDDARVRTRIEELVGRVGVWAVCPHAEKAGCDCRKPAPALILRAARALGVRPEECVVVGDIGSDVDAARAAGARSVLVPTPVTRREEIAAAPHVAATLGGAVDLILSGAV